VNKIYTRKTASTCGLQIVLLGTYFLESQDESYKAVIWVNTIYR